MVTRLSLLFLLPRSQWNAGWWRSWGCHKHLLLPVTASLLLPRWTWCCRWWSEWALFANTAAGTDNNCLHARCQREESSQPPWFTVVFNMRSGWFAYPVDFSADSGTAKSPEELWLEIRRGAENWSLVYCLYTFAHILYLYIFCMMHGRAVISILLAG